MHLFFLSMHNQSCYISSCMYFTQEGSAEEGSDGSDEGSEGSDESTDAEDGADNSGADKDENTDKKDINDPAQIKKQKEKLAKNAEKRKLRLQRKENRLAIEEGKMEKPDEYAYDSSDEEDLRSIFFISIIFIEKIYFMLPYLYYFFAKIIDHEFNG